MRTTLLRFLPFCALLATGCVIEVEDDDDSFSGVPGTKGWAGRSGAAGSGTAGVAGAGGVSGAGGAGGEGGAVEAPAYVRFAHLAPNTDAVDICLRPVDFADTWSHPEFIFGPVFAQNAADFAAEPSDPELTANPRDFYFPGVSTYFEIQPAGRWEVRLVPAVDDVSTGSCERVVDDVADLSLDLRSGQVLTVGLIGDRAIDRGGSIAVPLGWSPIGDPDADSGRALGQVVNALSGGDEITLATFDAEKNEATPVGEARPTKVGTSTLLDLPVGVRSKYVFLGNPDDAANPQPQLTSTPTIELDAKPGEVWTFFAAGTAAAETADLLKPQAIACRNLVDGRAVNDASLIAADCVYLNSSVPAAPAPEPTELSRPADAAPRFLAPPPPPC